MVPLPAEQSDAAGIGSSQAFADFDGGGLTCAIGAEQPEALALCHLKIDACDGDHFAEGLPESAQREAWRGGYGGRIGEFGGHDDFSLQTTVNRSERAIGNCECVCKDTAN